MIPSHHKDRVGISYFHRISVTFHQWKSFVISFCFINNVSCGITHKGFTIDITDRTTFHQFHCITGRKARRSVDQFFQLVVQLHDLILVGREVDGSFPGEIRSQYRSSVQCHFPSLVLDIPSIYISESILVTCKSRKFEELIISVGTIIGQIDS